MSDGTLNATIDFSFFGGGYLQVTGDLPSSAISPTLVSYGTVPIFGDIQPVTIDFTFTGGIETPIIDGRAANLSFGFTGSSTVEFGVQRYASVANNVLFDYTATSTGYNLTHANFNPTLEFTLETSLGVFSLGDGAGLYSFGVTSTGLNISTRPYSDNGASYVSFDAIDSNGVDIVDESNSLHIINDGITYAVILQ